MNRLWIPLLLLPALAMPRESEVKVRRNPHGRIEIRNALRADRAPVATSSTAVPIPDKTTAARIRELSARYGVSESLIRAVARAESAFNPYAVSRKGAVGIMQLMPDTARRYGVNNRFNSLENLEAGVQHLKYLSDRFNGSLSLILAAYNAGEEAVRKHSGIPPFRETRDYIRKVMRFMGKAFTGSGTHKTTLYKVVTPQGRILITNTPPPRGAGKVELLK